MGMDSRSRGHCGRGCCLSGWRRTEWASGREVGWLNGRRRMEASFVVFGMMMGCSNGWRMQVSFGVRWESYWTSDAGAAGRMLSYNACLGLFPRWDRGR